MKTPRQKRAIERVNRMMDALGELIDEHGYENVSTTMIAHKSSSAIGSFYQFFDDREDAASALRRRRSEQIVDATSEYLARVVKTNESLGLSTSLADCFSALHKAMLDTHKNLPGTKSLPVSTLTIAGGLFDVFRPYAEFPNDLEGDSYFNDHLVVAVATSAGCVKAALRNSIRQNEVINLSDFMLRELADVKS